MLGHESARTVVIGEASDRHREVYDAVLRAQLAGLEALKPGMSAKDVDAAARNVLAAAGLAEFFGHGLGHGLGSVVHDLLDASHQPARTRWKSGRCGRLSPAFTSPGFENWRADRG